MATTVADSVKRIILEERRNEQRERSTTRGLKWDGK